MRSTKYVKSDQAAESEHGQICHENADLKQMAETAKLPAVNPTPSGVNPAPKTPSNCRNWATPNKPTIVPIASNPIDVADAFDGVRHMSIRDGGPFEADTASTGALRCFVQLTQVPSVFGIIFIRQWGQVVISTKSPMRLIRRTTEITRLRPNDFPSGNARSATRGE